MDSREYARRHTLLPFLRAVSRRRPALPHGHKSDWTILRRAGMSLARAGVYFCRSCNVAARDELGFSFYRRDHQIPGVHWCPTHHEPLLRVEDERAFESPPHWHEHVAIRLPKTLDPSRHPIIGRYYEVVRGMLEQGRPLDIATASRRLRRRALQLRLLTTRNKGAGAIGETILSVAPHSWLSSLLPNRGLMSAEAIARNVDLLISSSPGNHSATLYALAVATLYDSGADGIRDIWRLRTPTKPERGQSRSEIAAQSTTEDFSQGARRQRPTTVANMQRSFRQSILR